MTVLGRFEVLPLQGQIDIRDPAGSDYPQWETGEERAVSTAQVVAVATRGDIDGRVTVEVRQGPGDIPEGVAIAFDGELLLSGDDAVVGNYLAGEEHRLSLGPGWHRVTVYVQPPDAPAAEVVVVVDAEPPSE